MDIFLESAETMEGVNNRDMMHFLLLWKQRRVLHTIHGVYVNFKMNVT